jgi:hypothetical protein
MKKLLFILVIMLMGMSAFAQKGTWSASDTLTNTDTVTWAYPTKVGGNWHMTIQVELDSVSGTAIAPTFAIQASLDNVNWYTLATKTLKPANAEFAVEALTVTPYLYYRIYVLNTGTNKSAIRTLWVWKSGV